MYYKQDYSSFLHEQDLTQYDYLILDPPWNYSDKPPKVTNNQVTYALRDNSELHTIFSEISIPYVFLWVTNSMLPVMFDSLKDTEYDFKILIPWIKLTNNESLFFGLGNHFRNCVEYVALITHKDATPLRIHNRNIILEKVGKRTQKPKNWENDLVHTLSKKGLKGVYIFSGGDVKFIDCVDVVDEIKLQEENLF